MKKTVSLLFFLTVNFIFAQSQSTFGILPKVVVSVKLPKNFKLVNSIESRQVFFEKTGSDDFQYNYDYALTELTTLLAFKTSANQSLAFGYRMGITDNKIAHQLIQQFSFVQRLDASRIGHRFSSDQTFVSSRFALRIRYRFTFEKPLNGSKIDPKEFYLKINNEYLLRFTNNKTSPEIRLAPVIGYEISDKNKIEFGLDYRISSFINSDLRNRLWLSLSWFFSAN